MKRVKKELQPGDKVFVGIDMHKLKWHVTARTAEFELFCGSIPGKWEALQRILDRYQGHRIFVVYEAGYFGFWLPTEKERYHRQVIRRRRQLIGDRIRTQSRIKAELRLHGIDIPEPQGKWTKIYLGNLGRIRFKNRWMQESFNRLLELYYFLDEQINKQTDLLRELSKTELYQERVQILTSTPGIGMIAAMELLLELQDVSRFQRADQIAAYVGLTPSQYSSADKIRMGRITCIGKNSVRAMLIQASWTLIRKDGVMKEKYDRLKSRSGGKRAIVAIARTLLIRMRRLLLDKNSYVVGLVATN